MKSKKKSEKKSKKKIGETRNNHNTDKAIEFKSLKRRTQLDKKRVRMIAGMSGSDACVTIVSWTSM